MPQTDPRARVLAEALTWLGTPYHHRGKLKGIGVDCAQLPLCVYAGAGVLADFDTGPYPADWHQHRDEERYAAIVLTVGRELPDPRAARPGDLILWKFGRAYSHGTLLIDRPLVIHASRKDGGVVLADIARDSEFIGRPARAFSVFEGG